MITKNYASRGRRICRSNLLSCFSCGFEAADHRGGGQATFDDYVSYGQPLVCMCSNRSGVGAIDNFDRFDHFYYAYHRIEVSKNFLRTDYQNVVRETFSETLKKQYVSKPC